MFQLDQLLRLRRQRELLQLLLNVRHDEIADRERNLIINEIFKKLDDGYMIYYDEITVFGHFWWSAPKTRLSDMHGVVMKSFFALSPRADKPIVTETQSGCRAYPDHNRTRSL